MSQQNGQADALALRPEDGEVSILEPPKTLRSAHALGMMLSRSTLIPQAFQGNSANVMIAVIKGAAIGLPPMQALDSMMVVNGRATLWGDAMLGVIRRTNQLTAFSETQTPEAATCTAERTSPTGLRETREHVFSVEDAKTAKLWDKAGPWKQFPPPDDADAGACVRAPRPVRRRAHRALHDRGAAGR